MGITAAAGNAINVIQDNKDDIKSAAIEIANATGFSSSVKKKHIAAKRITDAKNLSRPEKLRYMGGSLIAKGIRISFGGIIDLLNNLDLNGTKTKIAIQIVIFGFTSLIGLAMITIGGIINISGQIATSKKETRSVECTLDNNVKLTTSATRAGFWSGIIKIDDSKLEDWESDVITTNSFENFHKEISNIKNKLSTKDNNITIQNLFTNDCFKTCINTFFNTTITNLPQNLNNSSFAEDLLNAVPQFNEEMIEELIKDLPSPLKEDIQGIAQKAKSFETFSKNAKRKINNFKQQRTSVLTAVNDLKTNSLGIKFSNLPGFLNDKINSFLNGETTYNTIINEIEIERNSIDEKITKYKNLLTNTKSAVANAYKLIENLLLVAKETDIEEEISTQINKTVDNFKKGIITNNDFIEQIQGLNIDNSQISTQIDLFANECEAIENTLESFDNFNIYHYQEQILQDLTNLQNINLDTILSNITRQKPTISSSLKNKLNKFNNQNISDLIQSYEEGEISLNGFKEKVNKELNKLPLNGLNTQIGNCENKMYNTLSKIINSNKDIPYNELLIQLMENEDFSNTIEDLMLSQLNIPKIPKFPNIVAQGEAMGTIKKVYDNIHMHIKNTIILALRGEITQKTTLKECVSEALEKDHALTLALNITENLDPEKLKDTIEKTVKQTR